jgi:hypothetical protein
MLLDGRDSGKLTFVGANAVQPRVLLSIAAFLWAASAVPARADITADYYLWGIIGPTMRVQVSDSGNARVEMGKRLVAIRRNGVMYLVRGDDQGEFVLTVDEFGRIETSLTGDDLLEVEVPDGNVKVIDAGTEVVGGRTGIVLMFQEGTARPKSTDLSFVVNNDADLRPIGPVVSTLFGPASTVPMPAPVRRMLEQVHGRGTLIRMWFMLRLTGTSNESIPVTAFELPGPVLTGEEAYARLGRAW